MSGLASINGKESPEVVLKNVHEMKPKAVLVAYLLEDGVCGVYSSATTLRDLGWMKYNIDGMLLDHLRASE